jgi:hypothetical protein
MKKKNTNPETENKPEIRVRLTEDYKGMPEGSTVYVDKELKYTYKGVWCSMGGSYTVTVPKKICQIRE